jgi:hypothetical protein
MPPREIAVDGKNKSISRLFIPGKNNESRAKALTSNREID